jgi:hypothetical protein
MRRFKKTPILSKSDFLRYLQCHKYLWLNKKRKDLLPETAPEKQALFDHGYAVENLSHLLFEDGVEVQDNFQKAAKNTKALMASGHQVLYQATAFKRPLLVRGDILKWNPETELWDLYEVKSSTRVKHQHISDIAFQKYAFEKDGISIGKCHLIHINKKYVQEGEIDAHKLFTILDLTEQIKEIMPFIMEEIPKALIWLEYRQEPNKRVGKHCEKPYPCPFKDYCWKDVPNSIQSTKAPKPLK